MRLKLNTSTAIVVKSSWANSSAIKFFLRRNECGVQSAPDGHVLFARVLDDSDTRGLWIELNTKEHDADPAVEQPALLIPWSEVLAVVVAEDFTSTEVEAQKLGISQITL